MKRALAYILAAAMLFTSLTACGQNAATTIRLMKIEGTVGVTNGDGREVQPQENLMIYSGYGMNTALVSYAWMNLDDVKLAKMDEDSAIQIEKSGKDLEIVVSRGGLFFHVTEPLADDETMSIRTSTMVVGIRGTCGWVRAGENEMAVYIIEGKVACSVSDPDSGEEKTDTVSGGEMARLILTPGAQAGERCEIIKDEFSLEDVPAFVRGELDKALTAGLRTEDTPEPAPEPTPEPTSGPTGEPAGEPTAEPAAEPSAEPTNEPSSEPTGEPISAPTAEPTATPTATPEPTPDPTPEPTQATGVAASGEYGDTAWTLSSDGILTFSGTGGMGDWRTTTPPWCKSGLPAVQSVVIENGITRIGNSTFRNCTELRSIPIPTSVTELGNAAFMSCSSLSSITLPHGVTVIPPDCFDNCTNLTSITIPNSVVEIYDGAFSGCSNLKDIHFQGTRSEFEAIQIRTPVTGTSWRNIIESAAIHYNG